jgi:hypothetical protein
MALASYQVYGAQIRQETRLNDAGTGIEDVHVIPYTITSGPAQGHRGVIRLPESQFTPDQVKAALEDAVNRIHQISALGQ